MPDLHWLDDPAWAADGKTTYVKCDYRLIVDNLMDLTHEAFVHCTSIGNSAVAEAPFDVTHGESHATVTRWMTGIEPPPFWAAQLGKPGLVDRWQIIRFEPPCTIAIDVGVAPAGTGAPEGNRSAGVNGYVLNTMTPETNTTCHYFWAFARNYRLTEQRLTTELREGVARIFGEDVVVLEAQQRAMDANPAGFSTISTSTLARCGRGAISTAWSRRKARPAPFGRRNKAGWRKSCLTSCPGSRRASAILRILRQPSASSKSYRRMGASGSFRPEATSPSACRWAAGRRPGITR